MNLKNFQNLLSGSALVAPTLGTIAFVSIVTPSYAVPLAFSSSYTFTGTNIGTRSVATVTGAGNSDVTLGLFADATANTNVTPTLTTSGLTYAPQAPGILPGNGVDNGTNAGRGRFAGFATGDFFGFTLTPDAGKFINLGGLSGNLTFNSRVNGGSGSLGLTLRIFNLTDLSNPIFISSPLTTTTSTTLKTFNIGAASLDNLTGTTVFRFTGTNSGAPTDFALDNVKFDGDVDTIPVPYEFETAAGLLVFGGYFAGKRYLKNKAKAKV